MEGRTVNTRIAASGSVDPGVSVGDLQAYLVQSRAPVGTGNPLLDIARFWFETRDTHGLPARAHFRPEELVRVLPDLFIIDLVATDLTRYRLVGTRLAENFTSDPTTRFVGSLDSGWGDRVFQPMAKLIARTQRPHLTMTYAPEHQATFPIAVAIGLPLFDENGSVNMILGAAVFGSGSVMQDCEPDRLESIELLP